MSSSLRRYVTRAAFAVAALAAAFAAPPSRAQAPAEPAPTAAPAAAATPAPGEPRVTRVREPEVVVTHDPDAAVVPPEEGEAAPKLRPWQKQQQPPDGKWLTDERGREYYIKKFKKPSENAYLRLEDNRVRLPGGMTIDLAGEDAEFFLGKIYRVDNIRPQVATKKPEPTADELAAKEAEYKVTTGASDRLRFLPIGAGLPNDGQWRNGFDLADVNLDGKLDIVHGGVRRQLRAYPHIFLGDGKGAFKEWEEARYPPLPYDYGDISVGDFNHDKKPDLAIAVHLRGLIALEGDGKGNFVLAGQGLGFEAGALQPGQVSLFSSRAVQTLDWDGDGRDEILALAEGPMGSFSAQKGATSRMQQSYGVALYRQGADGGWQPVTQGKTHPELFGDSLVTGDFDGDGRIDFAAGSNSRGNAALVHLHQADGSWNYVWVDSLRLRSFARVVAAADLDGDKPGRADRRLPERRALRLAHRHRHLQAGRRRQVHAPGRVRRTRQQGLLRARRRGPRRGRQDRPRRRHRRRPRLRLPQRRQGRFHGRGHRRHGQRGHLPRLRPRHRGPRPRQARGPGRRARRRRVPGAGADGRLALDGARQALISPPRGQPRPRSTPGPPPGSPRRGARRPPSSPFRPCATIASDRHLLIGGDVPRSTQTSLSLSMRSWMSLSQARESWKGDCLR